jgi:transposase
MVKNLLQQRRHSGDIRPRHRYSGRKPKILDRHRNRMKVLLADKPDLTLEELRRFIQINYSLPAIHYALEAMNLTYKRKTLRASEQDQSEIATTRAS